MKTCKKCGSKLVDLELKGGKVIKDVCIGCDVEDTEEVCQRCRMKLIKVKGEEFCLGCDISHTFEIENG